jgi:fatty acid desaturase
MAPRLLVGLATFSARVRHPRRHTERHDMSGTSWFIASIYVLYLAAVWLVLWWPAAIVFSLFGVGAVLLVLEIEGVINLI